MQPLHTVCSYITIQCDGISKPAANRRVWVENSNSYIICTTPRSGSTLLCDLLTDARVAGAPHSFFRRQSIDSWSRQWGINRNSIQYSVDFCRDYLQAAIRAGQGGTNVFGLRLMRDHFVELQRLLTVLYPQANDDMDRLCLAFGSVRFVYLYRKDALAQAISRHKAEQSGLWHRNADGSERERVKPAAQAQYSRNAINEYIAEALTEKNAWLDWYRQNTVEPLVVTCENLVDNPIREVAKILSYLQLDSASAACVAPRTAKLADTESTDWAERFKREEQVR